MKKKKLSIRKSSKNMETLRTLEVSHPQIITDETILV